MTSRRLFLLVEGNDDERFFAKVIVPLLETRYRSVHIVKFACMKRVNVCRLITSLHRMKDDYLVFADIDNEPGVRAKKHLLMERFCVLDGQNIIVIIREIESWYLAGLDESAERDLTLPHHRSTDDLSKEYFNSRIPRHFVSRIAFMLEILSRFSAQVACQKNRSFHYFVTRHHLVECDSFPELQKESMHAGSARLLPGDRS